jgi:hypothetical protein
LGRKFLYGNVERSGKRVTGCLERTQEGLKTLFIKNILNDIAVIIRQSATLTGLLPALSFASPVFAPSLWECYGTPNILLAQNACVYA